MTSATKRAILWIFYGGLGAILLLITTGILRELLPGIGTRIGYNSEGYLFAVVLALWIQFGLPRLHDRKRLAWAIGLGVLWALIGLGLLASDWPSRIRTLNESAFALAILIPYVSLRRPVRSWLLITIPILVALSAWAVVWAPESWIIDQAESMMFVVLGMLTFDVFDRVLLDPSAQANKVQRIGWYAFMILVPVIVSALGTDIRAGDGVVGLLLTYVGRLHECFIGLILVAIILHLVPDYRASIKSERSRSILQEGIV